MFVFVVVACRPEPREEISLPEPVPTGPAWADVAPVLDRCAGCHDHSGLIPPITSWEEAAALAPQIQAAVLARTMPPWPAGPADVAYRDDPTLTDDEIALVVDWISSGARQGDSDQLLAGPPPETLPRVDHTLSYPEPYTPAGSPDDVRCFVLDSRALGDVWLTGADVLPGNLEAAHHILVLAMIPSSATDNPLVAAWNSPGPGFDCNGEVTSSSFPGLYAGLGGWLPGRSLLLLPEGSGIHVPADALILVESHYYTPTGSSTPDDSLFQFMVEPQVEHPAAELRLTNSAWHEGIAAASGQTQTHGAEMLVSDVVGLPNIEPTNGLIVHSVVPHMHKHGTSTQIVLTRASGERLVVVDIPEWDFDWQLQYWLQTPLLLGPDDVLSLSCTYRADDGADLLFGTGSDEEMCVARLLVTAPD